MATTQRTMDVVELGGKTKDELLVLAHDVGLADGAALDNLHREDLLARLFQVASSQQSLVSSGILETTDEGYGFLRQVSSHVPAVSAVFMSAVCSCGLDGRALKVSGHSHALARVPMINIGLQGERT